MAAVRELPSIRGIGSREAAIAIRVQLGVMPPMLGDFVVQMLGGSAAVDIVGRSTLDNDAIADAKQGRADLLVVQSAGADSRTPVAQLQAAADLDILAISGDSQTGKLLRVEQQPVTLNRDTLAALALRLRGRA